MCVKKKQEKNSRHNLLSTIFNGYCGLWTKSAFDGLKFVFSNVMPTLFVFNFCLSFKKNKLGPQSKQRTNIKALLILFASCADRHDEIKSNG